MARRTLLLVAAVLLAAMGTGVLFLYVQTTTRTPSGSGTVLVLAPETAIAAGTQISSATRFTTISIDAKAAQRAGMVTNGQSLAGLFAAQFIPALTPVTKGQFSKSFVGQPRIPLGENTMNLAVQVDDPAKVGEFLYPGAKVAVWVIDPDTKPRTTTHRVQLVLPNVEVVTVGARGTLPQPSATSTAAARGSTSIVTLKVDQEQAATVLMAQAAGELYFTLLGDTTATPKAYDDPLLAP